MEKEEPELRDFFKAEIVGIQISPHGDKLWVCIDGICVLRVTNIYKINVEDMRRSYAKRRIRPQEKK